jgi:hypothetical protein
MESYAILLTVTSDGEEYPNKQKEVQYRSHFHCQVSL